MTVVSFCPHVACLFLGSTKSLQSEPFLPLAGGVVQSMSWPFLLSQSLGSDSLRKRFTVRIRTDPPSPVPHRHTQSHSAAAILTPWSICLNLHTSNTWSICYITGPVTTITKGEETLEGIVLKTLFLRSSIFISATVGTSRGRRAA